MTSWKRLFGKKNKKAQRKSEEKYDLWLQQLHHSYGPQENVVRVKTRSNAQKAKLAIMTTGDL